MSQSLRARSGDQPLPTDGQQNVGTAVIKDIQNHPTYSPHETERVVADFNARIEIGIMRYGKPLQTFNGRNAVRDLYEELLDATHYAKQWHLETRDPRAQLVYWSLLQLVFDIRPMFHDEPSA